MILFIDYNAFQARKATSKNIDSKGKNTNKTEEKGKKDSNKPSKRGKGRGKAK